MNCGKDSFRIDAVVRQHCKIARLRKRRSNESILFLVAGHPCSAIPEDNDWRRLRIRVGHIYIEPLPRVGSVRNVSMPFIRTETRRHVHRPEHNGLTIHERQWDCQRDQQRHDSGRPDGDSPHCCKLLLHSHRQALVQTAPRVQGFLIAAPHLLGKRVTFSVPCLFSYLGVLGVLARDTPDLNRFSRQAADASPSAPRSEQEQSHHAESLTLVRTWRETPFCGSSRTSVARRHRVSGAILESRSDLSLAKS